MKCRRALKRINKELIGTVHFHYSNGERGCTFATSFLFSEMFGLFKKKAASFPVIDRIWMSEDAKFRAMAALVNSDPSVIFIHWFDRSYEQAFTYLGADSGSDNLSMIREATHHPLTGRKIIFAEHHPLFAKEKEAYEKLKLAKAEVWSSLSDPLLKKFGSDRIIAMMESMGMKPDEIIEHPLISRSIRKAQEKIAKKVMLDSHSGSMEEWFERNFPD